MMRLGDTTTGHALQRERGGCNRRVPVPRVAELG